MVESNSGPLIEEMFELPKESRKILQLLSEKDWIEDFVLTGGTPLSIFFLSHRKSRDLDFFLKKGKEFPLNEVRNLSRELGVPFLKKKIRYIFSLGGTKVEFVDNSFFPFREIFPCPGFERIRVASFEDILLQKMLALVDRAEPKDYLDVILSLKHFRDNVSDFSVESLVSELVERTGAWDVELYFSETLRKRHWLDGLDDLELLIPVTPQELVELAEDFADLYEQELAEKLKKNVFPRM